MPLFKFLSMIITNILNSMNSPIQDQYDKPLELCLVIFVLDYMNGEINS